MLWVPAGVEPPPPPPPDPPPEPPPELVQLDTPPARIASNAANSRAVRRRLHPSGNNSSPQTSGTTPHPAGPGERAEDRDCQVNVCTATFPVAPALTVSMLGLKRHSAFAGSVPLWNVNVPPGENCAEEIHTGAIARV